AERLARDERVHVDVHAVLEILGVHAFRPAVPVFLLDRAAGEREPRLIEEVAERVSARHPQQDRRAVRHDPEALLDLLARRLAQQLHLGVPAHQNSRSGPGMSAKVGVHARSRSSRIVSNGQGAKRSSPSQNSGANARIAFITGSCHLAAHARIVATLASSSRASVAASVELHCRCQRQSSLSERNICESTSSPWLAASLAKWAMNSSSNAGFSTRLSAT